MSGHDGEHDHSSRGHFHAWPTEASALALTNSLGTQSAPSVSKSIEEAAAQLLRANRTWSSDSVTFSFYSSAAQVSYNLTDYNLYNIQSPSQSLRDNFTYALGLWDDLISTDFVQVADGQGTMNFGYADRYATNNSGQLVPNTASAAFAWYPGSFAEAGDSWVNNFTMNNADWTNLYNGEWGIVTTVHELGHAIGLAHPGSYNAAPGQSITYDANAEYIEDSHQYSIMSYFRATQTGADVQGGGRYQHPETPLLHDIAAAQAAYGAEMTTRATDTVYGFNSTADRDVYNFNLNPEPALAIWDAGGTDTLDFSGYTGSVTIDLRGGQFSSTPGMFNNVAIAKDAIIENAVGTTASDILTGNGANNIITGNGGSDTVNGDAGFDIFVAPGTRASYSSIILNSPYAQLVRTVNGRNQTTELVNIERIQFDDQFLDLTTQNQPVASIAANTLVEGNSGQSQLFFTVSLTSAPATATTINYSVGSLSATNGSDFSAPATGSITIPAGQTSGQIVVLINGDTVVEGDEQFSVSLTSASAGVLLGQSYAVGTILNDDSSITDDVGNTAATAAVLPMGTALTREIETNADNDWFAVELVNGTGYTFEARGAGYGAANATLIDPYLQLVDASGAVLAFDNDSLDGSGARIAINSFFGATGTYYLVVSENGSNAVGTYQVAANVNSVVSRNIISIAPEVAVSEGGNASIQAFFDSPLQTAVTLSVSVLGGTATNGSDYSVPTSVTFPPNATNDTIDLTIFDDLLAEGDESIELQFSITSGLATFNNGQSTFNATATIIDNDGGADDFGQTAATAGILIGGARSGVLEVAGDRDWFRLDAEEGFGYRIDMVGSGGGEGSLSDGLMTVYDANGNQVAIDDDSGPSLDPRLFLSSGAGGTFYIEAASYGDFYAGSYTIRAVKELLPERDDDAGEINDPEVRNTAFVNRQDVNQLTDPNDYFRFNAPETGTLIVRGNNLTADIDFQVLSADGNTSLGSSVRGGTSSESVTTSVTAGTDYLIRVYPYAQSGSYTLSALVAGTGADTRFTNTSAALSATENNLVLESLVNSSLTGNELNNTILGNDGSDQIYGLGGNDRIDGGAAVDAIFAGAGDDNVSGGLGNDNIYGDVGNDVLNGGKGSDWLQGDAGADYLIGEDGDDILLGGIDADTMIGGLGNDQYYVDNLGDVIFEGLLGGQDSVYSTMDLYYMAENIEIGYLLEVFGAYNLVGNTGNNLLSGNSLGNFMRGGDGGSNLLYGNGGNDQLVGWSVADLLSGGDGNDGLSGYAGSDILLAGLGDDTLDGGEGADAMYGDFGNDIYYVDSVFDQVFEAANAGQDTLFAAVSYNLPDNVEVGTLQSVFGAFNMSGNSSANGLNGNQFANTLFGGAGSDQLLGFDGDDFLNGAEGADYLVGGSGRDTFILGNDNIFGYADLIGDFEANGTDKIALSGTGFANIGAGVDYSEFVYGAVATTPEHRILYDTTTGALYYDADGSGAFGSIQIATVYAINGAVESSDFIIA